MPNKEGEFSVEDGPWRLVNNIENQLYTIDNTVKNERFAIICSSGFGYKSINIDLAKRVVGFLNNLPTK